MWEISNVKFLGGLSLIFPVKFKFFRSEEAASRVKDALHSMPGDKVRAWFRIRIRILGVPGSGSAFFKPLDPDPDSHF